MTDIGELVVRIKADAAQLEREMKRAQGIVKESGGVMSNALETLSRQAKELLPALTLGTVVEFGRRAFEAADHINDLALRTGFAGSTLSSLNIKLKQSGSNLDDFSGSINRMNNLIGEAAKGLNQDAIKTFDSLGLSVTKLKQLSPEDQFFEIAKALGQVENQATFTNTGIAIFGRSFANIAPMIRETNGRLREFSEEQKKIGNALSDEELKRIDEFGDKLTSAFEHAKLAAVDFLDTLLRIGKWIDDQPDPSGKLLLARVGIPPKDEPFGPNTPKGTVSDKFPGTIVSMQPFGPRQQTLDPHGSNADLLRDKTSALDRYKQSLQDETDALGLSQRALVQQRAVIEATNDARTDWENHLRASPALTTAEAENISELAGHFYDLQKAQRENEQTTQDLKDAFSDFADSAILDSKNLSDALDQLGMALAKIILQRSILTPLENGLFGAPGTSGAGLLSGFGSSIGKFLGFADGGSPPVGVPSIVGENGPELFVPNTAGTIVPNKSLGGSQVVVQQTINLSPGLAETVNAAIMSAAPSIAGMAHAGVMQALQKGGAESRIVGKRS